jgi:hypothetical protein
LRPGGNRPAFAKIDWRLRLPTGQAENFPVAIRSTSALKDWRCVGALILEKGSGSIDLALDDLRSCFRQHGQEIVPVGEGKSIRALEPSKSGGEGNSLNFSNARGFTRRTTKDPRFRLPFANDGAHESTRSQRLRRDFSLIEPGEFGGRFDLGLRQFSPRDSQFPLRRDNGNP